jgi:hypothetical protein
MQSEAVTSSVAASVKRGRGRPSAYDPAYCDAVIDYGQAGKSRVWIACELGVHIDTLHQWCSLYPDFSEALSRAKLWEQRFWEDLGTAGVTADKFNGGVWAKNMSCRFRADWTETSRTELTGRDGGAIEVVTDTSELSRRLVAILGAQAAAGQLLELTATSPRHQLTKEEQKAKQALDPMTPKPKAKSDKPRRKRTKFIDGIDTI